MKKSRKKTKNPILLVIPLSLVLFSALLFGEPGNWTRPVPAPPMAEERALREDVTGGQPGEAFLRVDFLDVGQADSILIRGPQGQYVLIDGGNNADGPAVVKYLQEQGVTQLAAVVATHPHEDHIGGLDQVMNAFPVQAVYMPEAAATTRTFQDFIHAVNKSGAERIRARFGVRLEVPALEGMFLAPWQEKYDDLNDSSAVLKLTYGQTDFLFMGDAENDTEEAILRQSRVWPAAGVLKVGHHGSRYSTGPAFLQAVAPAYAVISVGKDNDYGHPHRETMERLSKAGARIYRTDQDGTVVMTSDGKEIRVLNPKPER